MPTYIFIDKKTKKEEELFMTMSEMDEYRKSNPSKMLGVSSPAIVSGVASSRAGYGKPDSSFRDILKTIKKNNRGSKINTFD